MFVFDHARKGGSAIRTVSHTWQEQAIDIVRARRAPNYANNLLWFRTDRHLETGDVCRVSVYDCVVRAIQARASIVCKLGFGTDYRYSSRGSGKK